MQSNSNDNVNDNICDNDGFRFGNIDDGDNE